MTIVDATEALPYLGDEPAQVDAFQEGLDAARGHLSTFSGDLGTARLAVNASWHATEAELADTRTAGILTSGHGITSSLEAGSRAVEVYLTTLRQGRRDVDELRAEWDLARAQASALETRPLATIDDERIATADAGRLTDQFDDLKRRFKTVVVTIETAANDCSQALNTAAAEPADTRGLFSTVFHNDPLGPESNDPLAAVSGDDEDDRWYMGDNTLRHDAAAEAVLESLEEQLAGPDGVLDGRLDTELKVPKGSKNGTGNAGRADIYYDDGTTIWVWELKGSVFDDYRLDSQKEASQEAADYVELLNENGDGSREYKVGEPLQSEVKLDYTTKGNVDELVTVDNAPSEGGGLYYKTEAPPPETEPPASDDSWNPFSLGNPLTRQSPGERVDGLNDALNAPPDKINEALERSRDRINEGLNDELNPFDGKDDARISTALDESAEDIGNALRESLLGIAKAVDPFPDN